MEPECGYLLSSLVEELKYDIIYPSTDYDEVCIKTGDVHRPGLQLAGFYDYFISERLQLIGKMEMSYLEKYTRSERYEKLDQLMEKKMPAVIVCQGMEEMEEMVEAAAKNDVTLLSAQDGTTEVMSDLIRVVKKAIAPSLTRHGVLVEVYGIGVLILGESGVGKSEAALELLKRGHRLIADDAVELKAIDVNKIEGRSPELIRHYMELRGIGIIDVRQIFGVGAVKANQNVHLVVNLEPWQEGARYDRLGINSSTISLLGVDIAEVTIPVKPGRNLAIILEIAAMNQRQKFMGFNAAVEFTKQINQHFDSKLKK